MPRKYKKKGGEEEPTDANKEETAAPMSVEKARKTPEQLEAQIPVPYCCKAVARQCRKDAVEVLKALVERIAQSRSATDQEKLRRIERRLRTFLAEIFAKVDEHCSFEKVYPQKTQIRTDELDQNLISQLAEQQQQLRTVIETLSQRKQNLENFFFTELEREMDESFVEPTKIPLSELRLRRKANTISFDAFLDKYIESQNEYLTAIVRASDLLQQSFDELKTRAMGRFKEIIAAHTRTQKVVESAFCSQTSWERSLVAK